MSISHHPLDGLYHVILGQGSEYLVVATEDKPNPVYHATLKRKLLGLSSASYLVATAPSLSAPLIEHLNAQQQFYMSYLFDKHVVSVVGPLPSLAIIIFIALAIAYPFQRFEDKQEAIMSSLEPEVVRLKTTITEPANRARALNKLYQQAGIKPMLAFPNLFSKLTIMITAIYVVSRTHGFNGESLLWIDDISLIGSGVTLVPFIILMTLSRFYLRGVSLRSKIAQTSLITMTIYVLLSIFVLPAKLVLILLMFTAFGFFKALHQKSIDLKTKRKQKALACLNYQ